jgi:hypothetical protein
MLLVGSTAAAQPATIWTRGHPGTQVHGGAVTGDAAGNVIVVGQAPTNGGDYLVLKYDRLGTLRWVRTYDGGAGGVDVPVAVAADRDGNVIVTGSSFGGLTTGADYCTIKYGPAGDTVWIRREDGIPGLVPSDDIAVGVAVNTAGDVYVSGSGGGPQSARDVRTVKYSSAGDTLWRQVWDNPATHGLDRPRAVALDNADRLVVVGESWGGLGTPEATGEDFLVLKYAPNGNLLQSRLQPMSAGAGADVAHAVAIDNGNNIYLTGEASQSVNAFAATIRFSSSADSIWSRRHAGGGSIGRGIVADGSRGVVAGGDVATGDIFLVRYSVTTGDPLWDVRLDAGATEHLISLGIDPGGSLYVVGTSDREWDSRLIVARYTVGGVRQWLDSYGSGAAGATGCAVHVFSGGRFVVTGSSLSDGEIIVRSYDETSTAVQGGSAAGLPESIQLEGNFPNPFNPSTRIAFVLPERTEVRLAVYDLLGREVSVLLDAVADAGRHVVEFDAEGLASGMYVYRLSAGGEVRGGRMVLAR